MVKVPVKKKRGVRVKVKRVQFFKPVVPRKDLHACFRCRKVRVDEYVWYCPKCQKIFDSHKKGAE